MFNEFIEQRLDKIIDPEDVLFHDDSDYVMDGLKDAIGTVSGSNHRRDIASIISSRIQNKVLLHIEKNKPSEKLIKRITQLVCAEEIFSTDITFVLAKKLVATGKFDQLLDIPELTNVLTK